MDKTNVRDMDRVHPYPAGQFSQPDARPVRDLPLQAVHRWATTTEYPTLMHGWKFPLSFWIIWIKI